MTHASDPVPRTSDRPSERSSAVGTGRPLSWRRGAVVLAPLALLLAVGALIPVHVVQKRTATAATADDQLVPQALTWGVQLESPGFVDVRLPLVDGQRPIGADVPVLTGRWERLSADPQVVRLTGPGASVTVSGWYRHLVGEVDLHSNAIQVGLVSGTSGSLEEPGVQPVSVRSDEEWVVSTAPLGSGELRTPLVSEHQAYVGHLPVSSEVRSGTVVVSQLDAARALLAGILGLWPILTATLALLGFGLLVGHGLMALARAPGLSGRSAAVPSGLGCCGMLLGTGALTYVLPVRTAVLVLAPPIAGLAIAGARQLRSSPPSRPRVPPLTSSLLAIVFAVFALPLAVTRGWGQGYLQTDVVDTLRLTSLFWSESAFSLGTDFGNGFRLTDYAGRAAITGVFGLDPEQGMSVMRLLLLALVVLAAGEAARRLRGGSVTIIATTLLASLSASLWGLTTEGYNTRETFAALAILTVLVMVVLLPTARPQAWALLGVVAAAPLSLVPPYSAFLAGMAVAALVAGRHLRGWTRLRPSLALGLGAAVAGLPNLVWLYDVQRASPYIPFLNQLSYRLVPYHEEPILVTTGLGVLPFHVQQRALFGAETGEWFPNLLLSIRDAMEHGATTLAVLAAAGALFGGAAWANARTPHPRLDGPWIALAMCLVTTLVAGVAMRTIFWEDQRYAALMYIWTLAPLCVVAFGLLCATARYRTRLAKAAAVAGVLILAALNVNSTLIDGSRWFDSPTSSTVEETHLDQQLPVEALKTWARDNAEGLKYYVAVGPSYLEGSDDERVLSNLAEQVLHRAGAQCNGCSYRDANAFLDPERRIRPAADLMVVAVGVPPCRQPTFHVGGLSLCAASELE